jgi:hypothetical protein
MVMVLMCARTVNGRCLLPNTNGFNYSEDTGQFQQQSASLSFLLASRLPSVALAAIRVLSV